MNPNLRIAYRFVLLVALLIGIATTAFPQSITVNATLPNHETLDQRIIKVQFSVFLAGTTTAGAGGQWAVTLNGVPVNPATIQLATNVLGPYGASVTPTGLNIIFVRFDATSINGVSWILPSQTGNVKIVFTNTGNTLVTNGTGVPILSTPVAGVQSKNNWVAACATDILYSSEGIASVLDQCAPVNTDFYRWTYQYSLRFRNSTTWVTTNNQVHVVWGSAGSTSNLQGFLTDNGGNPNANFITPTFTGATPGVFLSFRSGFNPVTLALDGTNPFSYPAGTNVCNFLAQISPFQTAVYNCAGTALQKNTQFNSYDYDDRDTGTLSLTPTTPPTTLTSDQVCLGTNVNVKFTDGSIFNCIGNGTNLLPGQGAVNNPLNNSQRWVRFIYGGFQSPTPQGNIRDIRVAGTPVTDPVTGALLATADYSLPANGSILPGVYTDYTPNASPMAKGFIVTGAGGSGVPDANGVIQLNVPATATTSGLVSQLITTLSTLNHVVGQRFYVTLQYWNACNPYPTSSPVEISLDWVEIIGKPTPLTTTGAALCMNAATPVNFTVGSVTGGATVKFYNKNPLGPGPITTMQSGASANFSSANYTVGNNAVGAPFKTNDANGGYYSVWATQVVGGTCESSPIEVVIFQQPDLNPNTPSAPVGSNSVCNGPPGTVVAYTNASATPTKTIAAGHYTNLSPPPATNQGPVNLNTELFWSHSFPATTTLSAVTGTPVNVTYNVAPQPNPSITNNVSTALRYVGGQLVTVQGANAVPNNVPNYTITAGSCPSNAANLPVTLYGQTVGGAVTPDKTICNLANTGVMTLAGHLGSIVKWQRQFNATAPVDIVNTTTTYNEVPPNGAGTYKYWAVIQNANGGPCAVVNSSVATITVNAIPSQPTISQDPSSSGTTICADGVQKTVLNSTNGGSGVTYLWFKNAVSTGITTSQITLNTVAQSGSYTVQVFGAAPSSCPSPVSAPTVVTINPLPTAANPTGGGAVCGGNPAPDIVWALTGTAPFPTVKYTMTPGGVVTTSSATNTFTIVAPNPGVATTYQITTLIDANGCSGTSLGGTASVTIGGTAPTFDTPPALSPTAVCSNGGATTDPTLTFSLDPSAASQVGFTLTYKIDGSANRTKTFNTNAAGDPTAAITFSDVELDNTAPSPHVVTIVSILTPFGCLSVFNTPLNFTVNPTPAVPTGPVNGIACSTGGGVPLNVNDPGAGFQIMWSSTSPAFTNAVPGLGTASGSNNKTFTPTSSATATFYAFTQSTTAPTNCMSPSGLAVTQTQDIKPTNVSAGAPGATCTASYTLTGLTPTNGTGTWTGGGGVTFVNPNSPTTVVNNLPIATTTLTWTVVSTLGVCPPVVSTVDITRNPLPAAIDPLPALCETVAGGGSVAGVALTTYNDAVTGIVGSVNRTIKYYSDALRTLDVTAVPQTVTNGKIYYTTVTNATTLCSQNGTVTFIVNPLPTATNQNLSFCEDFPIGSNQHAGIDLTANNNAITGGAGNRSVAWFSDALLSVPVPTPANYTLVGNQTVYAKVTNTITNCVNVATVALTIKPRPVDNPIQGNTSVCTGNSIILYQLDPTFNPGSSYTWSVVGTPAADVQVFGGGGVNTPNFFVLLKFPAATGTVALDVFETLNGCQGNTQHMTITVNSAPPPNVINGPAQVCTNQTSVLYQVALPNGTSTYTWSVSGATLASSAGSSINVDFGTISPVTITVTETSISGCVGAPASSVVTVSPRPSMTSSATASTCSGAAPALTFTSTVASTYAWKVTSITGVITGTAVGNTGSGDLGVTFTGGAALKNVTGAVGSVTFDVTPTATVAPFCTGATQSVVLTVNPEPVLVAAQTATTCSNQAVNYTILLSPANLPAGTIFTWPKPVMSDASNQGSVGNVSASLPPHIIDVLVNTSSNPITATYTITPTSGLGCPGTPNTVVVTVNPQPVGANAAAADICSDAAVGYNLQTQNINTLGNSVASTFSWVAANNGNVGGESTSAQAGNTITDVLTNVTTSDQTVTYTVTPTSSAHSCVGASFQVTVLVHPKPVGVTTSAPAICSDANVNYNLQTQNINTLGNSLASNFSWVAANNGNVGGESTVAQAGNTITDVLTNTTNADQTVVYTVTPTGSVNLCLGAPFNISVIVHPKPVGINANATAICSDAGVAYNLQIQNINGLGNGVNSNFSWSAIANGNVGGESTAAQSTSTINDVLTNVTNTDQTVVYNVTPTSSLNNCVGAPFTVSVVVHPKPVGVTTTAPAICSDASVGYNLQTANVNTLGNSVASSFSWIAANNANVGGESTTAQSGALLNDVLTNVTGSDQTVIYTVTPTSTANTCVGASFQVSVVVHPKPVGANASAAAICSDATVNYNLQTQNINALGNSLNSTFSWIAAANGNVGGESVTAQAGNVITDALVNITNTDQTVVYTVTPRSVADNCVGSSFTVSVVVHPKPVGANAIATPVCSDAVMAYNLQIQNINTLGNAVNSNFSWVAAANADVGGESTSPQSGAIINDALTNVTNSDQTVVYTVTPTSAANSCLGASFTVSVVVHPKPVGANAAASAICSDASVAYNLQTSNINILGNSLNSTFSWIAAANANVGGESTTAQSGPVISDVLTNVTNTNQTVSYTVTPTSTANSCVGAPFTITVQVHPKPVGVNTTATAICSTGSVNYDLQAQNINILGNSVNSSFSWVATPNGNIGGESTTAQSSTTINDVLTNVTNADHTVVYTVTPTSTANLCVGASFTVSIVVHPEPVGANAIPPEICSDATVGYDLQVQNINTLGNSVASNFSWVAASNPNVGGETTSAQNTATITDALVNTTNSDQTVVYTVIPTSVANSCVGASFTVSVTVHPKPVGANATAPAICSDASVGYNLQTQNINTVGNSVNSDFTWIAAANANVSGESTSSQAGNTISDVLINVTNADQTVIYTVTPTSVADACVGATFTVSVMVHPKPVGVTTNAPAICSDAIVNYNLQTANINTLGNALNSNFSWFAASNGNVTGESTAAQAGNLLTDALVNVTSLDQTVVYTVTPTSASNGCVGASFNISVVVHPKPIGAVAVAPPICSDLPVGYNLQTQNIDALGNAVNSTFSWIAASNAFVGGESLTAQSGNTITDVLINVTNADQTVVYTVTPTNAVNGCIGIPFTVSATVHPKPVGINALAPAICSDASVNYDIQSQNINTLGNGINSTFSWTAASNANVGGESTTPQIGSLITDILVNVTNSDQTVIYTVIPTSTADNCPGAPAFTVTITVHPKPVGVTASAPAICSDATVGYNLQTQNINSLGNGLSATFSWVATPNANVSGESTIAQGGNLLTDNLVNVSGLDQTVIYTITPSGVPDGCLGPNFDISVLVHPKPVGVATSAPSICSDASVGYNLQVQNVNALGNGVNSTFSWIAGSNANVGGESTTNQTGATITDVLTNVTGSDQTVVYTVTPTSVASSCLGAPFNVSVLVHPKPVGVNAIAPAICSKASVNYDLQVSNINALGNGLASTFSWVAISNPNVGGESTVAQAGALITDVLTNVTNADQTVVYNVTPTGPNSCVGSVFTVSVTVRPEPVGVLDSQTICSDDAVGYSLQNNVQLKGNGMAGSSFVWVATANNPNVTGESLVAQNTPTITDVLNNVTANNEVITYSVTPTGSNGCVGNAFTITVTVQPEPVLVVATNPTCSGLSINLLLATTAGSGPVQSYNIISRTVDGGLTPVAGNANVPANGQAANYLSNDKFTNTGSGVPALNVTYVVEPVSIAGCKGNQQSYVVTILPEPVVSSTLNNEVCSAQPSGITLNTNGVSVGASSYDITAVVDAGLVGTPTTGLGKLPNAIVGDNFVNQNAVPLNVTYTVTPHGTDGCVGAPKVIVLKVDPVPVLFNPGFPAVCSSNGTNSNPVNVVLGTNGTSVNAASYKLVDEQYSTDGGTTFNPALPANFSVFGGSNASIGAVSDINLVKNDQFTNTRTGAVIVRYTIEPTGPGPKNCVGATLNYTVAVNPEPIMVPGTATVCSGTATGIVLSAAVGSAAITGFELQSIFIANPSLTPAGTNAALGPHAAGNFLAADVFTNTTSGPLHVIYTIVPVAGSCKSDPTTVDLTVNPAPAIASNLNKTVCSNAPSTINLAKDPASVNISTFNILGVVIQAPLTQTAGGSGVRMGVAANVLAADQFQNNTNGPLTVTYTVQGVSAAPCTGPTKDVVLTVEPTISVTTNNTAPDICSGSSTSINLKSVTTPTAGNITFNVVVPVVPFVSGYSDRGNVPNTPVTGFTISDVLVNTDNVAHTVVYQITPVASGASNGAGCQGSTVNVNVIVEPKPKLVASALLQTVCEGTPTNVGLTTPTYPPTGNPAVGTMKFEITSVVNTGGVTGVSPVGTQFANGGTLAETLSNPTFTTQTVTYTLTPKIVGGLGCTGDPVNIVVNVNPLPDLNPVAAPRVCSQDPFSVTLSSNYSNVINTWTAAIQGPGTATGFSNGSGDLIFQSVKNTGSAPVTIRYTVTPKLSGCAGTPLVIDVIIDPVADLLAVPPSVNVCYAGTLNVPLTSSVAGTTFAWTVDPNGSGVPLSGSGNVINQVLANPDGDFLTYHITATGPGPTSCASQEKVMSVIAAPQMVASFLNPPIDSICNGDSEFLSFELLGQPPFSMTYSANGVVQAPINGAGGNVTIKVFPTDTTVYKLESLKDKYGCVYPGPFPSIKVKVGSTNAAFVVNPTSSCSPYTASVQFAQQKDVNYNWTWGDGTDTTFTATTTVAAQTLSHKFVNLSPTSTMHSRIALVETWGGRCRTSANLTIDVFPTIQTNVFPDKTAMCSGETVKFTNNSFGVPSNGNKWFYRHQGVNEQLGVQTTKNASFTLTNTTATNPIVYEIVYQANNANNCPAPDVVTTDTVFREVTASFDPGTIPPFLGGNATITYTNTSVPIDPVAFRYDWDFGLDATPATATGVGPFTVNYTSPGPRDVTLTVTNIKAEADQLTCGSISTQTINIPLLPLVADFTAVPKFACYPTKIVVTSNTATGDVMSWKLFDNNGKLSATSDAPLPEFQINVPGKYTLQLTTSSSATGQVANAPVQDFEIYDKPQASFDVRPDIVYVPDTELNTFNFSFGATSYLWDFGDNGTSTDFQPSYKYQIEGKYTITLVAQNDHGDGVVCTDTLKRDVVAKQGGLTKVPNAFTPNPNGPNGGVSTNGSFNDVFLPIVKGVEEFNMQIYDRWGNLIFESNSASIGWDGYNKDGKLMPAGVYVYKLTVRLSDNQRSTQIGDVTMIR